MAKLALLFNVAVLSCFQLGIAWKLNVPRVLLPLADEGAQFLVSSEAGGCFTWSSTRPEVVKAIATKITEECGNAAGDDLSPLGIAQQETSEGNFLKICKFIGLFLKF